MKKSTRYKLANTIMYSIAIIGALTVICVLLYVLIKASLSDNRIFAVLIVICFVGIGIYCHNYIRTFKYSVGDKVILIKEISTFPAETQGIIIGISYTRGYIVRIDNEEKDQIHVLRSEIKLI